MMITTESRFRMAARFISRDLAMSWAARGKAMVVTMATGEDRYIVDTMANQARFIKAGLVEHISN